MIIMIIVLVIIIMVVTVIMVVKGVMVFMMNDNYSSHNEHRNHCHCFQAHDSSTFGLLKESTLESVDELSVLLTLQICTEC